MHIFFSVGEPSGDQHAAHLIGELRKRRPDFTCSGYGGPLMQQAGCRLDFPLTTLAVMGILRVLPLLGQFIKLVRQAGRLFRESPPDAVILVDFPGFNWWIARKAKRAGIPVFYYLPPQLWAWGPWRIRRVQKNVDYVISGLPFEAKWYAERGVRVEYVGHPFFDEVAEHRLDERICEHLSTHSGPVIGILPGSRNQEVSRNFPFMVKVMRRLAKKHPQARFVVANYRDAHRTQCSEMLRTTNVDLPVQFFVGKTSEIIAEADCCLMVSGSVSLELLARTTPAVVIYRLSHLFNVLRKLLLRVNSFTLPNLIAGRTVFPEFLLIGSDRRELNLVYGILSGWLSDRHLLALSRRELVALRNEVCQTGATGRAADAVLSRLPAAPAARAA